METGKQRCKRGKACVLINKLGRTNRCVHNGSVHGHNVNSGSNLRLWLISAVLCKRVTDRLTDIRTDGQTLLQRCEDASKNQPSDNSSFDFCINFLSIYVVNVSPRRELRFSLRPLRSVEKLHKLSSKHVQPIERWTASLEKYRIAEKGGKKARTEWGRL